MLGHTGPRMRTLLPFTACLPLLLLAPACKKSGEAAPPDRAAADDDDDDARGGGGHDGDVAAEETLTASGFEDYVQGKSSEIAACFTQAAEKTPGIGGQAVFDFTIAGDGRVQSVVLDGSSTLKDPAFVACVEERAAAWRLPKTRDGAPMTLTFPFTLR